MRHTRNVLEVLLQAHTILVRTILTCQNEIEVICVLSHSEGWISLHDVKWAELSPNHLGVM